LHYGTFRFSSHLPAVALHVAMAHCVRCDSFRNMKVAAERTWPLKSSPIQPRLIQMASANEIQRLAQRKQLIMQALMPEFRPGKRRARESRESSS
jgi:hypothetical protein